MALAEKSSDMERGDGRWLVTPTSFEAVSHWWWELGWMDVCGGDVRVGVGSGVVGVFWLGF